jgi:hypothetical protein
MAGFNTKKFMVHDDYMTPKSAWENIARFIPKDKVIWEPFYGDGKSGEYLRELGFEVIHEPLDFFENNLGDVIVSNPPFSKTKDICIRLKKIDKPFILVLPCSKIMTSYFRDCFKGDNNIQIIIPRKRIHFQKQVNGVIPENYESKCNFDCFYYCYKINLPNSILWLE